MTLEHSGLTDKSSRTIPFPNTRTNGEGEPQVDRPYAENWSSGHFVGALRLVQSIKIRVGNNMINIPS